MASPYLLALLALASYAQPRTLACLGDSTTAGTPYFRSPVENPPAGAGRAEASFPYWLARGMPGWRVLNLGVNGERSDQILDRLGRDALAAKPDFVLVLAGINDLYQGLPQARIRRNLARLYRRVRAAGATPIAASVLPCDGMGKDGAADIASLNAWIAAHARREGINFVDLHAAAADPGDPRKLKGSPDGLHPDAGTYRAVGEAAARAVLRLEALSPASSPAGSAR